ncbi:amyloid fiber anchoring/assembly protein TapA [Heyndrickxia sporothermodurans]|uniref:amyloid fiber anchoring/assembly protein TapA n=1 Tax=Heyndrickxia sporothermodurans TaxID=46224 RepID=UPI0035D714D0
MEGGLTIRTSRLRKFKSKNKRINNLMKIFIIWYLVIFTGSYLTSNTGAYFNDTDDIKGTITAGTWEVDDGKWDKSSLKFLGEKDQTIKSCVKTTISAAIKNTGNNMKDTSKFEVYSAKKGNPKDGSKIGEGTIPKLATNKSMNLTFDAKEPGNYKFKALQRPGHPGKGELWSETITIDCNKTKTTTTTDKDENAKDDKKNETNTPEKQQSNSEDKKGTTDKQENSDESSKNTNEKQDPKNSNGNTNEKQNPKNLNDNTNQKQEPKDPSSDGKEKTTASEPKDDGDANIKSDGDQK